MKFILGKKLGMSQRFRPDGTRVSVTHVQATPMVVTQVKTAEKDGYTAVQLGMTGKRNQSKPVQQHLKDLPQVTELHEFRVDDTAKFERGQSYTVQTFAPGDVVKITGVSKGKGFAGVVKRHGFGGSPKTHGHKDQLRMPGSIGATDAQRVFKGKRMAGRMGAEQVTIRNLEIVDVDAEHNELLISGAVPGARHGLLIITAEGDMPEPVQEQKQEAPVEEVTKTEEATKQENPETEVKAEASEEKTETPAVEEAPEKAEEKTEENTEAKKEA